MDHEFGLVRSPRAFILAAGLGTRLRPLTERVPKPLVEVAGVPMLDRTLSQVAAAGVRDAALNVFHLGDAIRAHVGDGSRWGLRVTFFDESDGEILGTGGGLRNARSFLTENDTPFLLVNGDVWHDFDLRRALQMHDRASVATLVVHRDERLPKVHVVGCIPDGTHDQTGRVTDIHGTPAGGPAPAWRAIYTGVAVLEPRLLDRIPEGQSSGLVDGALWPAMRHGDVLRYVEPSGHWFDIGTPASVLRASTWILRRRADGTGI